MERKETKKEKLLRKIAWEQDNFIAAYLSMEPLQLMYCNYHTELYMRQEIADTLKGMTLSEAEAQALLRTGTVMHRLYLEKYRSRKTGTGTEEIIRRFAGQMRQKQAENKRRSKAAAGEREELKEWIRQEIRKILSSYIAELTGKPVRLAG